MKKQYIFSILLLFIALILPKTGFAAYNTVTFDADTDLYFTGSAITLTVSSGSMVASFTVNSTSLEVSMESGSTITLTSADKRILTSNLGTDTVCGTDSSTLTITSATTQTVSIDIGSNSCSSGGAVINVGSTSGGGSTTPPPTSDGTTPSGEVKAVSEMTISEVKARIAEISQMIAQLQTQLVQMLGGSSGSLPQSNMKLGDTGEAVKLLQTWLATDSAIYPEGLITGYFGSLTKAAVIRFQEKYKEDVLDPWNFTSGTGIVGPTTRAKLEELFGSQ